MACKVEVRKGSVEVWVKVLGESGGPLLAIFGALYILGNISPIAAALVPTREDGGHVTTEEIGNKNSENVKSAAMGAVLAVMVVEMTWILGGDRPAGILRIVAALVGSGIAYGIVLCGRARMTPGNRFLRP